MQNDYRQCKWCGQIYRYCGNIFCNKCVKELDADFRKIKDFLYKNQDATIPEVVENTKVDEQVVFYLLREGRLEMKSASGLLICEKCGVPIHSGRMCKKCSETLSSVLSNAVEKPKEAKKTAEEKERDKETVKSRMHTYVSHK